MVLHVREVCVVKPAARPGVCCLPLSSLPLMDGHFICVCASVSQGGSVEQSARMGRT
ncbi:hypothetical protein M433DRAFT_146610 [Acidomyces richmondensis BFW]|nr:MAG: hypothetical protein FE78DRAFT_82813 [Acidomyces sp. 'richmondensis']KYG42634.1 hypothetical protein M433DRAFT_146610 [Acidomyces richmondensis BFW]